MAKRKVAQYKSDAQELFYSKLEQTENDNIQACE